LPDAFPEIGSALLMRLIGILCALFVFGSLLSRAADDFPSIARYWDEEILAAIRIDLPNPPVHARNLFHLSAAMYDAWAAYDPVAVGYTYHQKHLAPDIAAARRQAISYAAYRILTNRYVLSKNAAQTLPRLQSKLTALGYGPEDLSEDPALPTGVGNRVAAALLAFAASDGSLQERAYADLPVAQGGYSPRNPPLLTLASGTLTLDPNRWQPLAFTNAVSQNDIPADLVQKFLGSQWLGVRPFALTRTNPILPWIDPGPPPQLGTPSDAEYRRQVLDVIRLSSQLSPDDGVTMNISPGAFGNNTLGANDGVGRPQNPVTGAPYETNVVKRGDFARVLAEFWADGPNSETPPGHWNVLANSVSDSPGFERRFAGIGAPLDRLEWDVKLYFAINAALHDAACAAWSLKRYYDGWRPIEAIRYMGQRGQSSITSDRTYDPFGLPLEPGLVELVSAQTVASSRHAGLSVGTIAIHVWPGPPADPTNDVSHVRWINAADWLPYQKRTFITPAFPGYISGHSTFSRAAAEVLAAFTGSPFFPGGLASHNLAAGSLGIEHAPSQATQLQWATYFDASDQAGISRLWGGIHVEADDLTGRKIGAKCGQNTWALAKQYFDGSIAQAAVTLTIARTTNNFLELRANTIPGFTYSLESTPECGIPFQPLTNRTAEATASEMLWHYPAGNAAEFLRIVAR
jgi:hypothetical protein